MSNHSLEPWKMSHDGPNWVIEDKDGECLAIVPCTISASGGDDGANALRIFACILACEGTPTNHLWAAIRGGTVVMLGKPGCLAEAPAECDYYEITPSGQEERVCGQCSSALEAENHALRATVDDLRDTVATYSTWLDEQSDVIEAFIDNEDSGEDIEALHQTITRLQRLILDTYIESTKG